MCDKSVSFLGNWIIEFNRLPVANSICDVSNLTEKTKTTFVIYLIVWLINSTISFRKWKRKSLRNKKKGKKKIKINHNILVLNKAILDYIVDIEATMICASVKKSTDFSRIFRGKKTKRKIVWLHYNETKNIQLVLIDQKKSE